ncbi:hypothetical protein pqer_cds_1107 [Pandoravirus quercus]|uniref:Uncharacterized protein n=1 Tax=Pandoravirus quercus TaxID=2107709 RepID=A0A2U7UAR7_9VIRU|nr:hypothetical protein pqer_cds_1107 [Pandoravirus quercus]AVK75529.1 hypothetical protein pqer_cds_1107 [Pandoravirus quercus]
MSSSGTRLGEGPDEDPSKQSVSQSPDVMGGPEEPNSDGLTAPEEITDDDDDDDDLSKDYDDVLKQMPEPDGDWKREWLDANKDKLLSVVREEERILAAQTPT